MPRAGPWGTFHPTNCFPEMMMMMADPRYVTARGLVAFHRGDDDQ